jgi:arginine decarboxylase-like protein
VEHVLRYVQFEAQDLIQSYHEKFLKADLSKMEACEYLEILMEGLKGYTYLED